MTKKADPYRRIILAARAGVGVHLSADEVFWMSGHTAIRESGGYYDDMPINAEPSPLERIEALPQLQERMRQLRENMKPLD